MMSADDMAKRDVKSPVNSVEKLFARMTIAGLYGCHVSRSSLRHRTLVPEVFSDSALKYVETLSGPSVDDCVIQFMEDHKKQATDTWRSTAFGFFLRHINSPLTNNGFFDPNSTGSSLRDSDGTYWPWMLVPQYHQDFMIMDVDVGTDFAETAIQFRVYTAGDVYGLVDTSEEEPLFVHVPWLVGIGAEEDSKNCLRTLWRVPRSWLPGDAGIQVDVAFGRALREKRTRRGRADVAG